MWSGGGGLASEPPGSSDGSYLGFHDYDQTAGLPARQADDHFLQVWLAAPSGLSPQYSF